MTHPDASPLVVSGSPEDRGHAIALAGRVHLPDIRQRIALTASLLADEEAWLARQWQSQREHVPEVCEQIEGMAAGLGVSVAGLFGLHIRYAVEDRRAAPPGLDADGCSAFVVRTGTGTTILAKNRDNPLHLAPLQLLLRQRDAAWGGREVLSVGSFGGVPSASSGINSDGFCLADTAVRTGDLGEGVLRYYLMEALLGRCSTVADALDIIRGMPHVGGGTLVMSDAAGAMAAVELGHSRIRVEADMAPDWVARTNHHTDPELSRRLVAHPGSPERACSEGRHAALASALHGATAGWTEADSMAVLASHGDSVHPALCRHTVEALTLSGAVFDPVRRSLLLSHGNPCGGDWRRTSLAPRPGR